MINSKRPSLLVKITTSAPSVYSTMNTNRIILVIIVALAILAKHVAFCKFLLQFLPSFLFPFNIHFASGLFETEETVNIECNPSCQAGYLCANTSGSCITTSGKPQCVSITSIPVDLCSLITCQTGNKCLNNQCVPDICGPTVGLVRVKVVLLVLMVTVFHLVVNQVARFRTFVVLMMNVLSVTRRANFHNVAFVTTTVRSLCVKFFI